MTSTLSLNDGNDILSESIVDSLNNIDNCSICLDEININNDLDLKKLPCNHIYHKNCINQWITNNPNCPLCKEEFNTDDIISINSNNSNNLNTIDHIRNFDISNHSIVDLINYLEYDDYFRYRIELLNRNQNQNFDSINSYHVININNNRNNNRNNSKCQRIADFICKYMILISILLFAIFSIIIFGIVISNSKK